MSRRRRTAAVVAFILTGIVGQAAWAAWLDTGTGTGATRARTLALTGNAPTVGAAGGDITVSWAQNTFSSALLGTYAGGGYRVRRYDTGGTPQTVSGTCNVAVSGSTSTLSCNEQSVPLGTWRYGVTPVLGAWSGTESTRTQVVVDSPPSLVALEMKDGNANGKIDQVVATFSETLASYSAGTTPWTLANVPSSGMLSSVTVDGTTATLTITEGAGAANTAVGSFTVALAANANGIRDAGGSQSSFAPTAPTDKSAPARIALEMKDGNANGRIEQVLATFSETLAAYGAGATPWTLANVPSSGTLSSVSVSGTTATLTLNEGAGAANTAVGTFTVALTSNAGGIRDAASNQSSFAATAPTDKAAPIVTAVTLANANGQLAKDDTVTVTFTEALSVASLCPTWSGDTSNQSLNSNGDVTLTVTDNGSNDLLTVSSGACTLRSGQLALGANYVTGVNVTFSGNGSNKSTVTWVVSSRTLTFALGAASAGPLNTGVPASSVTYSPAAGVTDPAGNGLSTSGVLFSGQRF